jgi:hypothetical protein
LGMWLPVGAVEEVGTSKRLRSGEEHPGECIALKAICVKGINAIRDTSADAEIESESEQRSDCWGEAC